MKTRIITAILFILLPVSLLLAQNQTNEWRKNQIKFSPLRIVNLFYPGFELSYERQYGRLASQISAAYLCIPLPRYNSCNGYRFNFEEKLFFKKQPPKNNAKFYLSLEGGFNNITINEDREFLPAEYEKATRKEQRENAYLDNFDIQREAIITNCKFGVQFRAKRIIFDISIGMGLIFQNVTYYNVEYQGDKLFYPGPDLDISSFVDTEGKSVLFNVPMSFKIGYSF
ncbi:MAG: hypothetical protein LBN23_07065 [Paludibacter sp.]|jgi:hypothetical protein|nr:hypothetical protein [Paludibacter sp.]